MTDTNTNNDNSIHNDPMLTAYALGELEPGSAEYERVAALIEQDEQARAFVQQTRALAGQLQQSYLAEDHAADPLSPSQQQSLADAIASSTPIARSQTTASSHTNDKPMVFRLPRRLALAAGLAIAASAAIATLSLMDDDTSTRLVTPVPTDASINGMAKITDALNTPVPIGFDNAPLSEVLTFIETQTHISITPDWPALASRGIDRQTLVTLKTDELQPAQSLLSAALHAAWQQSPHPDPAQWALTDAGITVGPKSKLVQARLDATAKLLAARHFSPSPIAANLTQTKTAEAWDNGLWNDIRDKRAEAGQLVIEEAAALLDAADAALAAEQFDDASQQTLYAYHLLGRHAALLQRDQLTEPFERIASLNEQISDSRLAQDKAAIAEQVKLARANDTELDDYTTAMQAAFEAIDNESFAAAGEAVLQGRLALAELKDTLDAEVYKDRTVQSLKLHAQIEGLRRRTERDSFAKALQAYSDVELEILATNEARLTQEIRQRLTAARDLQVEYRYSEALAELDAAMLLDPDNPVIAGLSDIIRDSSIARESQKLHRERDLGIGEQRLLNIEATTPYHDILTYPGDWPELSAVRLRGLASPDQTDQWEGSVVWNDNYTGYASADFESPYASNLGGIENLKSTNGAYGVPWTAVHDLSDYARFNHSVHVNPGVPTNLAGTSQTDYTRHYFFRGYQQTPANRPSTLAGDIARFEHDGIPDSIGFDPSIPIVPAPTATPLPQPPPQPIAVEVVRDRDRRGIGLEGLTGDAIVAGRLIPQAQLDTTLSRRQQVEAQLQRINSRIRDGQQGQQAPDAEHLLTDEQHAQLQAVFEQRLLELARTEPMELARINALHELAELERQFIEQTRIALLPEPEMQRDAFALVNDNPFHNPADEGRAMSTFSVDVDTAGYSIVRKQIMSQNRLPQPNAVRIEEMINYFDYGYEAPIIDSRAIEDGVVTQASLEAFEEENEGFAPFATDIQITDAPWQAGNKLVRIGIQGMDVSQDERPAAHLTFLLDVSGSMNSANKLPLVKQSMKLLLEKLNGKDRVSIVVYAGASGLVLENASALDRDKIERALDRLKSGGSTAGAAGIRLAYQTAQKHFIDGGVNRVILCTDGDFNVGISNTDQLVDLIKEKANPQADEDGKRRGVYLSVMGYGMGNLNDAMMEPLTNAGNGNYAYIDSLREAEKVMYDQAGSTLVAIAKDVKVQVHFDPAQVMAYRLIGYENRVLANEDFENDKVDAGDIGANHSVTALYEIVPNKFNAGEIDDKQVRQQIEMLDEAIALNKSLMQTASLNANQQMKLTSTTKMLEQERALAAAAIGAEANAEAEAAEDEADVEADEKKLAEGAMLAVRLRYKPVDAPAEDGTSRLIETPVFANQAVPFAEADESTRFAASVAGFGMVLRSSPHAGNANLEWVVQTAATAAEHDPTHRRHEFIELVKTTAGLMPDEAEPAR